jgi:hypothetical protein
MTTATPHLSVEVFRLASECGLPIQPGELAQVSDASFLAFRSRYLAWSAQRDAAVHKYLRETPRLFRALLPYTTRVLAIAMQAAWYMDELVTRDPLFGFLENPLENTEQCKRDVVATLQLLSRCYEPIRAGYLILYGSPLFPRGDSVPNEIVEIAKRPNVRAALEVAARYGFSERVDERGLRTRLYQVELDSSGLVGMRAEGLSPGTTYTVTLPVGAQLPEITREALLERIGDLGPVENVFAREVQKAVGAVKAATFLGAAVLFDRKVDDVIVQSAALPLNRNQQLATVQVLDAVVPYLAGVPPEGLYELRNSVPNAFIDFRGRVHSVVEQAMKDGVDSGAEIRARVDREIAPAIGALDAEAAAEARRGRIVGYGGPAVVMTGLLVGTMAGLDPSLWPMLAALGGSVKAASDYHAASAKQRASPFYFLWEARRR